MNLRHAPQKRPPALPGLAPALCVALVMLTAAFTIVTILVEPEKKVLTRDARSQREQAAPASLAHLRQQKRLGVLRRCHRMRKIVVQHGCGWITLPDIQVETLEIPSFPHVMHVEMPGSGGAKR